MASTLVGVFVILHGLVHLLYVGHSLRRFELRPGLTWPDGSWAFSRILGDGVTRTLASVLLAAAALMFAAAGAGIVAGQPWAVPLLVSAAALSSVLYVLLWDGHAQRLADKGAWAILINAMLVGLLFVTWPRLA